MRTSLEPTGPVQRIIEFKLPLQYLLSILGGIAVMIVTDVFQGASALLKKSWRSVAISASCGPS